MTARRGRNPVAEAFAQLRGDDAAGDATGDAGCMELVCLADVPPLPVAWLWRHRLARATLNLLEGPPALGKTTAVCDLIARTTTGAAWPDESPGATRPPADVCIVGPEDTPARVLVPRLTAAGADMRRVHLVRRKPTPDNPHGALALPRDGPILAEALEACRPALLYFDALSDLLVGVRINDDAEVRAALRPLVALAEAHDVCALATRHFGKGGNRLAMYAGLGSVAFSAVARVVLQLYPERAGAGADPAAERPRLLAVAKNNLAPYAATLRFRLESTDGGAGDAPPRVRWDGSDDRTADDLQAEYRADDDGDANARAERTEAEAWLVDALSAGKRGASDLRTAAKADGIAWRTLQRAGTRLGVRVERLGFGGGSVWHPPAGHAAAPACVAAQPGGAATEGDPTPDEASAPPARSRHSRHSRPRATPPADGADGGAAADARAPRPRRLGARGGNGANGANGANVNAAERRARVLAALAQTGGRRTPVGELAARAGLATADARAVLAELDADGVTHTSRAGALAVPRAPAAAA